MPHGIDVLVGKEITKTGHFNLGQLIIEWVTYHVLATVVGLVEFMIL